MLIFKIQQLNRMNARDTRSLLPAVGRKWKGPGPCEASLGAHLTQIANAAGVSGVPGPTKRRLPLARLARPPRSSTAGHGMKASRRTPDRLTDDAFERLPGSAQCRPF